MVFTSINGVVVVALAVERCVVTVSHDVADRGTCLVIARPLSVHANTTRSNHISQKPSVVTQSFWINFIWYIWNQLEWSFLKLLFKGFCKAVADLGVPPPARPKIFSISCSFCKIWQNHVVTPPTGNLGSAPVKVKIGFVFSLQFNSSLFICQMYYKLGEHNYAQPQFSGWEFSIESQTEGCKKPIMNTH